MPLSHYFTKISKLAITVLIVGFWYGTVWAAGDICPSPTLSEQLSQLINVGLSLMSWLWIPLASLAGTLMGNGFLYGKFINMDQVLIYLRGISRTGANFAVAGLILWKIISGLMDANSNNSETMKSILKLGGGLILAHMSRFLIGAVIDVSTILTDTVASLPSNYMAYSEQTVARETVLSKMKIKRGTMTFNPQATLGSCNTTSFISVENATIETASQYSDEELLDMIMPKYNSIFGPLYYIGAGVLRLPDYLDNASSSDNTQDKIFVVALRFSIIFLYIIILIMLIVINVIRIGAVWFAVAFAPLLIILKMADIDIPEKVLGNFNIGNIIKLIFAPVVAVGLMSIALIVIMMMQPIIQDNSSLVRDGIFATTSPTGSTIGADQVFSTTIKGNILGEQTTASQSGEIIVNTFSNLIMIGFTLFLLYGVLKALMMYLEKGIGSTIINKIGTLGGQALGSIPAITLPGGGKIGLGAGKRYLENEMRKIGKSIDMKSGPGGSSDRSLENMMRNTVGLESIAGVVNTNNMDIFLKKMSNKSIATIEDYNKIIDIHNKDVLPKTKNTAGSLGGLQATGTALQQFFQKMDRNTFYKLGGTGKFTPRKDKGTINDFITSNYNILNKPFFEKIYNDIGGDTTALTYKDKFWDKNIKRKK